jgi:hypothetical protein
MLQDVSIYFQYITEQNKIIWKSKTPTETSNYTKGMNVNLKVRKKKDILKNFIMQQKGTKVLTFLILT